MLDAPVERVVARCRERGVDPGYPLARDYPEHDDALLIAITEQRSRADIDRLAEALEAALSRRDRVGDRTRCTRDLRRRR